MPIDLVSTVQGVVLPIKASAGARKTEIQGSQDGRLKSRIESILPFDDVAVNKKKGRDI